MTDLPPPGALPPPGSPPPGGPPSGPPPVAPAPYADPFADPYNGAPNPYPPYPTAPHPAYGGAPGWGAPPPPGPGWGPGWLPVHKPGIVALRPLGLGDIYDGAFQAIRQNPKTVVGLSVVLVTGALVLPTLASVVLAATGDLVAPTSGDPGASDNPTGLLLALALNYLGQLLVGLAGLLLTGLIVHVVAQAVLGRRTSAGEAWRAVRGRMLRLVGLTLLAGLVALLPFVVAGAVIVPLALFSDPLPTVLAALVLVPLAFVASVWVEVRFFLLANPALVLERVGIGQAIRRAGVLSRGQFWRLFGIYLLTALVVGIVGGVLGVPFTLLATFGSVALPPAVGGLVYVLGTYVGLILTRAITTPFTAAVVALQYVDQRIRKEAFDVELLSQAGQPPAGS